MLCVAGTCAKAVMTNEARQIRRLKASFTGEADKVAAFVMAVVWSTLHLVLSRKLANYRTGLKAETSVGYSVPLP